MGKHVSYRLNTELDKSYSVLKRILEETFQEKGLTDSTEESTAFYPVPVICTILDTMIVGQQQIYRVGVGFLSDFLRERLSSDPLVIAAEYTGTKIPPSLEAIAKDHKFMRDSEENTVKLKPLLYYSH